MALCDRFQRHACRVHTVAERKVAEMKKVPGGGANCRDDHQRVAILLLRHDVDRPSNGLDVLQRCAAELHDDHAAPPINPRATASSALRMEPPAAPRSVL